MNVLCYLLVCSFFAATLLTPLCTKAACRLGLVDRPDGHRKLHHNPIPRVGGIAIALAYTLSFSILLIFAHRDGRIVADNMSLVWRLFPAAGIVFATGLLDDLITLTSWQKLLGNFAGAAWAYWAGVRIVVGGHTSHWWSLPLTLLWLAACTNAFNLIDGLDGLAAGIGFLATLTILLGGLIQGNFALAVATIPLAGALIGFLRYNLNPASIFLGDCGSLLIGFLLGCFGVIWSQKSATILGMTAPLMALSIPILDVCLSVIRRFLRREPLFRADRGHIHHRLLDRGLTQRQVVVTLYAACGVAACFSVFQSVAANHYSGAVIL